MTAWAVVTGPGPHGGGFRRAIVDSDFAWLVKMCYHEIGNADPSHAFEWGAMLWTITNRWASRYGQPGETLGEYAQRFSEPINPAQIGVMHPLQDVSTADDPGGVLSANARWARIRANRARPISCYATGGGGCSPVRPAPELVGYVLRFMRGEVWDPRYLALMDWAARGYGHGAEDVLVDLPTADAFYHEAWASNWPPGTVLVGAAGAAWGTSPMRAGLSLAAGVTLAALGIAVLVRRRRGMRHRWRRG